ncbi:hypothetical protein H5410_016068, partial [Solanum commersonii]
MSKKMIVTSRKIPRLVEGTSTDEVHAPSFNLLTQTPPPNIVETPATFLELHVSCPNLEELYIYWADIINALCSHQLPTAYFSKLQILEYLPSLESVNNDDEVKAVDLNKAMFNSKVSCPSLEYQYIKKTNSISSIYSHQYPMARSFLNLQILSIYDCQSMEEVITKEEQLEELSLNKLPKLGHFFLTDHALKFPFLIRGISVSTPSLEWLNYDCVVKVDDLNNWTQQRFNSKEQKASQGTTNDDKFEAIVGDKFKAAHDYERVKRNFGVMVAMAWRAWSDEQPSLEFNELGEIFFRVPKTSLAPQNQNQLHRDENVDQIEKPSHSSQRQEFDVNDLKVDPVERTPILNYHPNLRDEIRRAYIIESPCRTHQFPQTIFLDREWLEYSNSTDAAYYLPCYISRTKHQSRKCEDLMREQQSIQAIFYKLDDKSKHEYQISLNLRFSFRGHDESESSLNKGNFLEVLSWCVARCDAIKPF